MAEAAFDNAYSKHMRAHFRAHLVERLGEKMSVAHPGFQCAERVFHRLTADEHHIQSLV